nr:acyl-CoA dehydrogenase family protein [Streptomyces sp. ISL-1]
MTWGWSSKPLHARAAVAKLTASNAADRVIDRCVPIVGGHGYDRSYPSNASTENCASTASGKALQKSGASSSRANCQAGTGVVRIPSA